MKKLLAALVAVLTICLLAGIPVAPVAQAAGAYWIGVDITNQITTVYRSSDDSVVRHMLCSTGLDETPTPTGTFYMPKKAYAAERTEWYYFKEFDCYAKYATRIKGGILFHSVIYSSKSDSSLRTSSVKNLGKKASHGCIRLTVDNAKWIAKNCPAGTKVKIYYGKKDADLKQQLTGSYQTLEKGDSGKSVKSLQERLKECGWYSGSITGKYDSATQNAVKAFQKAQGLTADGKAGSKTQKALFSAEPAVGLFTTLKQGDKDLAVEQLQRMLTELGVYTGNVDGNFDAATAQAVKDYQRAQGLSEDGIATPSLQSRMAGDSGIVAVPDPTPTPEPEPVAIGTVTIKTNGSTLNMRAKASSSAKVLAKLKNKAEVKLIEDGSTWIKVWDGTQTGYIMKKYAKVTLIEFSTPTPEVTLNPDATLPPWTTPEPESTTSPAPTVTATPAPTPTATPEPTPEIEAIGTAKVKTNGGTLNMRATASNKGKVVTKLKNKAEVELLAQEGSWAQIRYKGKTGYVMSKYLKITLNGDATAAPEATVKPTATPLPETIGTAKVKTNGSKLAMRKSMSTSAKQVTTVPNKATVDVVSVDGKWAQIIYKNKIGYALSKYLKITYDAEPTPTPEATLPAWTTPEPEVTVEPETTVSPETTLPPWSITE